MSRIELDRIDQSRLAFVNATYAEVLADGDVEPTSREELDRTAGALKALVDILLEVLNAGELDGAA